MQTQSKLHTSNAGGHLGTSATPSVITPLGLEPQAEAMTKARLRKIQEMADANGILLSTEFNVNLASYTHEDDDEPGSGVNDPGGCDCRSKVIKPMGATGVEIKS